MKPKPELHVVGTSLSDARWYEHRDTGECNITTLHFRTGKDAVAQIIADSRGGVAQSKKTRILMLDELRLVERRALFSLWGRK